MPIRLEVARECILQRTLGDKLASIPDNSTLLKPAEFNTNVALKRSVIISNPKKNTIRKLAVPFPSISPPPSDETGTSKLEEDTNS